MYADDCGVEIFHCCNVRLFLERLLKLITQINVNLNLSGWICVYSKNLNVILDCGYGCKFCVYFSAPPKPTSTVAFSAYTVNGESATDLSFKCEVATVAGTNQAYKVSWFVDTVKQTETSLLKDVKISVIKSSVITVDFSLKKVCVCSSVILLKIG